MVSFLCLFGSSVLVDTMSLFGEQTSYMSICLGEGPEEELQHLTVEQLSLKVSNFVMHGNLHRIKM